MTNVRHRCRFPCSVSRSAAIGALALALGGAAGCLGDSQIPTPVIGANAGDLSCSARYPLLDDSAGAGAVAFGTQGMTQSTNPWGAGARFHLGFTFRNQSTEPVHFNPAGVRLRDALGVDLRLVEVKRGDQPVAENTVDPGAEATIDLFFAGTGLKLTPQKMATFSVDWPYAVGESWWTRTTRCKTTQQPPVGDEGFGPWVSVRNASEPATERAQPRPKPPQPTGWDLHYTR